MNKYDLVVVGAGPGGYPLAISMAKAGWKVAIVDRELEFGGTCLNWGCIPTKALLASAHALHLVKNAARFGLDSFDVTYNWENILSRKDEIVSKLRNSILTLLEKSQIDIYKGTAKLCNSKIIKIDNQTEIRGDKICLAIGSEPFVPGFFPTDRNLFWTSNEALKATKKPESLLVVGGGVIGMELGQVFSEFGTKVTIVELMPNILPGLDSATAKRLTAVFKKKGIEIITGKPVEKLSEEAGRVKAIVDGKEYYFEKALLAIGRRVNKSFTEEVEFEDDAGFIKVNEDYLTSQADIYAIGDAIKGPMLAHKATYDAMILARKWSGEKVNANYSMMPSCVYTTPEIAWIGTSEDELKKLSIPYKIGRSLFTANGKAMTSEENDGQIKTLFSEEGMLLGAVIWGPQASNLINYAGFMGNFYIPANHLSDMIFPHPTLSEAYFEAVESAFGKGVHS